MEKVSKNVTHISKELNIWKNDLGWTIGDADKKNLK